MKNTKADRDKAIQDLRDLLKPGDTVYTILRDVSRSGMSRNIDVQYLGDGEPRWLSYLVAKATGFSFNDKRECLRVGGCGMDMGFHVVSTLGRVLYPDGFGCVGERCPSNDHSNGDRDYTPGPSGDAMLAELRGLGHWHQAGDYALRHRWL